MLPGTENIIPGTPGGPSSKKYNEELLLYIKSKQANYKTNQTNQAKSAGIRMRKVGYHAGPLVPLALLHLVVRGVLDYPFLLKKKIGDTSAWFKMSKQLSVSKAYLRVHATFLKSYTACRLI